jgi:aspartate carbamoyltransferase catalytic subunit
MSLTDSPDLHNLSSQSDLQLNSSGRLRHLLSLRGLGREQLTDLLDLAETFISPSGSPPVRSNAMADMTVANLFFEPSTRTRASFELAAKRLGADVLDLDINTSSQVKGEELLDTIYTLQAMQVDVFVIRDAVAGTQAMVAQHVDTHVSVLNAGEANCSHPTQGLLDLLTIRRHKKTFGDLIVAIVGDIAHSRVAQSAADGLATMGVGELRYVAPPALAPVPGTMPAAKLYQDLDSGIRDADVVMALRVQNERIKDLAGVPARDEYFAAFGLTNERMQLAAPGAIVMHPGPVNRGVEIDSTLADGPSSVITEQVANGVAVRMAVLTTVAKTLTHDD